MYKVTGRQCKAARSLLKWNVHDLANRLGKGIEIRRIEGFERNIIHLVEWENNEIMSALKDAGITFTTDFEVKLDKSKKDNNQSVSLTQGTGSRIVLAGDLNIVSDDTFAEDKKLLPTLEDKKLKKAEEG